MKIRWSREASDDVGRLHAFLESANPVAAAKVARMLVEAPDRLLVHSRIGERLHRYGHRDVRHLRVAAYDLWYEIQGDTILIVRIRHQREDR
ncbi:type II toxin-antitoxin system RelE/ParE family toxin [Caulobacter mirabilis]|uniref:Plasmid stabilization protein n=1 Tax=Caulobacter mirabilis TaxID=69666 RepID=A0A2D2AVN6_9CAUL|nr:type II toxin-antitoxin system RelE/ParE family toxin [Caulobacter mirabilis]ATQ42068.1 plasmid stabilization protein [Caulobacter mirabilis]